MKQEYNWIDLIMAVYISMYFALILFISCQVYAEEQKEVLKRLVETPQTSDLYLYIVQYRMSHNDCEKVWAPYSGKNTSSQLGKVYYEICMCVWIFTRHFLAVLYYLMSFSFIKIQAFITEIFAKQYWFLFNT